MLLLSYVQLFDLLKITLKQILCIAAGQREMLLRQLPTLKKVSSFCLNYPMKMQRSQFFPTLDFKLFLYLISFLMCVNLCIPQLTHTLSVSLNKIGDLKYYDGDLEAARSHYFRSLEVRRNTMNNNPNDPSQVCFSNISPNDFQDVEFYPKP